MDTRFWGPDGWKLLHSIAVSYPDNPTNNDKDTYKLFFNCLKFVLPCIYCRRSYTEYISKLPIDGYLENRKKLSEWLYSLHNLVNDKLRKQGLNDNPDPPFKEIHNRYLVYVKEINDSNCINMPGWDFIYCIIFNFPKKKIELETERYINYIIFFNYLPKVLPFITVRDELYKYLKKNPIKDNIENRKMIINWGYSFEKIVSNKINCNCASLTNRKNHIELHRAGCGGIRDRKPTCRLGNSPNISKK